MSDTAYCFNCESEAVYIIASTGTPFCLDCHSVYRAGQRNPNEDADIIVEGVREWNRKK